jgi:three-Cys-motif partner protein
MTDRKATGLEADPHPEAEVERGPEEKGVGRWVPEQKHSYLTSFIDGTRQAAKKWPSRVFVDPFCGPGRIQVKGETISRDGGSVLAWKQSVLSGAPYTQMLVGDLNPARAQASHLRLSAHGAPVSAFTGSAVSTIKQMAKVIPPRSLCFVYLDPYNLELLSFELIKTMSAFQAVDFAVHFSTMDLSRNVDFEFDPARARFDETAPGWRDHIDVPSLNKTTAANAFFEYWVSLVQGLGFTLSASKPLIKNDSNSGIYRLVFFSRHPLPNRIWKDVTRSPTRDLFD